MDTFRDKIKFSFRGNGRIGRLEYLTVHLIFIFIVVFFILLAVFLWEKEDSPISLLFFALLYFGWIWLKITTTVKRFHDLNEKWNKIIWLFVPVINIYYTFLLPLKKWTNWTNQFWPNPLICRHNSWIMPTNPADDIL